jgi:hypothetical protein
MRPFTPKEKAQLRTIRNGIPLIAVRKDAQ